MNRLRRRLLQAGAAWSVTGAARDARARVRAGTGSEPRRNAFIERLIAQMTLEEKAGQLNLLADTTRPSGAPFNPEIVQQTQRKLLDQIAAGHVSGLFNGTGVAGALALQRIAVEQSRLKIPMIFAADIVHGARTSFPSPLAEASAFDPELTERTARAAALEATALGVHWNFAPMVDIARDQRWGRNIEGSGEDPYLGRLLAVARVKGFQGDDLRRDDSMLATMKHFAGYGAVNAGLEYNSAEIAETTLREVHLPPFKAGIDAGALSVMTGFNDIAGVPVTANAHLLTGILRDEWAFRGLVVCDYDADAELVAHGYAKDGADAACKALMAGCDMSMASGLYMKHVPTLVRERLLPMAVLDRAVRRVLGVKQALGLFDNPYRSMSPVKEATSLRTPATVELARAAARRSVVLLKNDAALLPLSPQGQRIALIGPFAQDRDNLAGPWANFADRALDVSLAQGMREAMDDPDHLEIVAGCGFRASVPGGIEAALEAAARCDVVILALGEPEDMSGEDRSRADIGIPAAQMELAEAVAASGKPIVVVLRHGRALALQGAVARARAIVAGWFLGCETGHALADLIFGSHSPSGRLPVSFPRHSGQQPYYYNHRRTGRPEYVPGQAYSARYAETSNTALYPFGHGLTFGDIVYGPTQVGMGAMNWDGEVRLSASITNRGVRAAREVAQLYTHQRVSGLTKPVRELKGFKALTLEPGETAVVDFALRRSDLSSVQPDLTTHAEPGWFDAVIAPNAEAGQSTAFELLTAGASASSTRQTTE